MRSLSRTVRPPDGKQRAHVALALVAGIVDGDQQLLAVPGVGPGQEVIPRSVAVPGRHAFQQGPVAFPHSRLSEHRQETRRVRSEVLPLTWAQVDFAAGTVRLEVRTTKNDRGRTFVMTPDLRALLGAQRKVTPGRGAGHAGVSEAPADCDATPASRLSTDGGQGPDPGWRHRDSRDADDRPPDAVSLWSVRHRLRAGPSGGV